MGVLTWCSRAGVAIGVILAVSLGATMLPRSGAGDSGSSTHTMAGHLMVPAAAAVAAQLPLPRTGWTATANGGEPGHSVDTVLDGQAETFWHTPWSTTTPPRPHTLTIDTGTATTVSALVYTPRPAATGRNGTVGRYQIETSPDGADWTQVATGTWADDNTDKTATFATTTTRHIRLLSLTEAGNRGPWTSAAEINLLGGSASTGSWGAAIGFPLVPSSAAILPGNKVLVWSAFSPDSISEDAGYTQTATLDLTTLEVSQREVANTGHDMFCPGTAWLPDGRLMVTGGSDDDKTSFYDPATDTWTPGPDMTIGRGYHTTVPLADGSVFAIGGSWNGGIGGKIGEVWTAAGGWRALPGVTAEPILTKDAAGTYRSDNHAWLFPVSGGRLVHAGPSSRMNWITTQGDGTIIDAGTRGDSPDAMNGTAVYYDIDKIITMGGAPDYDNDDATDRAYTVDLTGAQPRTRRVGDMHRPRTFHNSVALPDGTVLVLGGQSYASVFTDTAATTTAELWDPVTGQFTELAPAAIPRTYHSTALLLPDARVLSAGGGQCGNCATNHPDGEIFTPPYLLTPSGAARTRPAIRNAPTTAVPGTAITVEADAGIVSFSLVREGAVTHTVNSDQRRVPLTVASTTGTGYQLEIPADRGVVLPGRYMLFAMDAAGTPSVSAPVTVTG